MSDSSANDNSVSNFKLIWRNVTYTVQQPTILGILEGHPKQLIHRSHGEFRCGQLTALMGPSGCGKSTLLACLTARRRQGVTGEMFLHRESPVRSSGINMGPILNSRTPNKLRSAFIPQYDIIPDRLTARECLLFAAKLKQIRPIYTDPKPTPIAATVATIDLESNHNSVVGSSLSVSTKSVARNSFLFPRLRRHSLQHQPQSAHQRLLQERLVDSLLQELQLKHVADQEVSKLSGGQRRRLSIGQELTGVPNMLFLDEPTTGLDSSASNACVRLLRDCAHGKCRSLQSFYQNQSKDAHKMMVVVIIHQPSQDTLELFDWLNLLGKQAKPLYAGKPMNLLQHLRSLNLSCPPDRQPIEYLMDIASGSVNPEAIVTLQHHCPNPRHISHNDDSMVPIRTAFRKRPPELGLQIRIFLRRHWIQMFRSKLALASRISYFVAIALLVGTIFPENSAKETNCPRFDLAIAYLSGNRFKAQSHCGLVHSPPYEYYFTNTATIEFNAIAANRSYKYDPNQVEIRTRAITNQLSRMGFAIVTLLIGAMLPLLVSLPGEFLLLKREQTNGDCSILGLLISKWLAELPIQTFCPLIFSFIADICLSGRISELFQFYPTKNQTDLTHEIFESQALNWWRLAGAAGLYVFSSWIGFVQATCIGAWFAPSLSSSLLMGPMSLLPLLLFSGVFVRTKIMPDILQIFAHFSYLRNAFQLLIHCMYGFGRCNESDQIDRDLLAKMKECDLGHLRSLSKGLGELLDVLQQNPIFQSSDAIRNLDSISIPMVNGIVDLAVEQPISPLLSNNRYTHSFIFDMFDIDPYDFHYDLILLFINFVLYMITAYLILRIRSYYFTK